MKIRYKPKSISSLVSVVVMVLVLQGCNEDKQQDSSQAAATFENQRFLELVSQQQLEQPVNPSLQPMDPKAEPLKQPPNSVKVGGESLKTVDVLQPVASK